MSTTTASASASRTLSQLVADEVARLARPLVSETKDSPYREAACTHTAFGDFSVSPRGKSFIVSVYPDTSGLSFAMTTCGSVAAAVRYALRQLGAIGGADDE